MLGLANPCSHASTRARSTPPSPPCGSGGPARSLSAPTRSLPAGASKLSRWRAPSPAMYYQPRIRRGGRLMSYGNDLRRRISPGRRLCRPDSQGREAGRPAGRAADQVRVRHQPQDREGARPRSAADAARPRRRGDRMIRRREFITLLGGAAAAWPLAARAQQASVCGASACSCQQPRTMPNFRLASRRSCRGWQQLGWTIGHNVRIDMRWATAMPTEIRRHAAELVALAPDVILAHGGSTVGPLLQATRTVPIVFPVVGDPVGAGFVDSLARPGGNVTGFMTFEYSMGGKWLELLKQIAPGVTRAAVLRDPAKAPRPASSALSRRWRRRSGWKSTPSMCATPARSSAPLRLSPAPAMAV